MKKKLLRGNSYVNIQGRIIFIDFNIFLYQDMARTGIHYDKYKVMAK